MNKVCTCVICAIVYNKDVVLLNNNDCFYCPDCGSIADTSGYFTFEKGDFFENTAL